MSWLDSLPLTELPGPVQIFFRDDDAGWGNQALARLLGCFACANVPLDVAVIPAALDLETSRTLEPHLTGAGGHARMHQHGFAHRNHEVTGRKCEYGPSREPSQVLDEVLRGCEKLRAFGDTSFDLAFTPPWNRCDRLAAAAIRMGGVRVLSRDATAPAFDIPGLAEFPVHVDWFRRRKGRRMEPAEIAAWIAQEIAAGGPVGVMLHHEPMDEDDFRRLEELLAHLTSALGVECVHMRDLLKERER